MLFRSGGGAGVSNCSVGWLDVSPAVYQSSEENGGLHIGRCGQSCSEFVISIRKPYLCQ